MVQLTDETVSTLISLIEILKDGEIGYRNAAEKATLPELKNLFSEYQRERAEFIFQLRQQAGELGFNPETPETAARAMHRGWMILRSASADERTASVLAACQKGEDEAVKNYRDALAKQWPVDLREILERQYMKIKTAHDRVRALEIQNGSMNSDIGAATDGAVD